MLWGKMGDEQALMMSGTLAGFAAVGWYVRTSVLNQTQALRELGEATSKAILRLSDAIEKLKDHMDTVSPPSREQHAQLILEVNRIALRQMQIGTVLETLRRDYHHDRRDNNGG